MPLFLKCSEHPNTISVTECTFIAIICKHDVADCLLGFPSTESFLTLYLPYCYSFLLGSTSLSSLITIFHSLDPIGKPYASYYVLLV